jgi:hypothetical protein
MRTTTHRHMTRIGQYGSRIAAFGGFRDDH